MGKKRKSQTTSEIEDTIENKTKVNKVKQIVDKNIDSNEGTDATTSITQPVKKNSNISNCSKPKKITFVDDEPQEVPVTEGIKKNKKQKNKRSQNENEESNADILREEDAKEGIDKLNVLEMGKKGKSQTTSEIEDALEKKTKVKKVKQIKIEDKNIDSNEGTDATTSIAQSFKKNGNISNCSKPKKIIFVDDEPQEVPVTKGIKNNKKQKNKRSQNENEESYADILREEDVKDEDIDKFCDELNEEDNKQYEDWVRLIEANLSSNKKKPK